MVGSQFLKKIQQRYPMLWQDVPNPYLKHEPHQIAPASPFLALLQLQSQSAERTAASSEQGHPVPIQKAAPNGSGRMNPLPPSPGCQARNDYGIDIWSMVDLYRACHWVHMSPHECKSHSFFYICFLCFVLSVQN